VDRGRAIRQYLWCLERADARGVLGLFAPGGDVVSPLYGRMLATDFYPMLFADTARSRIALHHALAGFEDPGTMAADFVCEWDLADGTAPRFRCVDVFTIGTDTRITRLAIIYDTARVPRSPAPRAAEGAPSPDRPERLDVLIGQFFFPSSESADGFSNRASSARKPSWVRSDLRSSSFLSCFTSLKPRSTAERSNRMPFWMCAS